MSRDEAERIHELIMEVSAIDRWTPDQKALLNYFLYRRGSLAPGGAIRARLTETTAL